MTVVILGFVLLALFAAGVYYLICKADHYGKETRKREQEFERASKVEIVDEKGEYLTIYREPISATPENATNRT